MKTTYNTKQKNTIISFLSENKDSQYTCDEISDILKKSGTPVGKTTVYRCLDYLSNQGKVRKIVGGNSKSAFYQYIDDAKCHNHLHLKCLKCGTFVHLGCDFMHGVNEHLLKHHNFTVDNSKTVLYGVCDKCMSE